MKLFWGLIEASPSQHIIDKFSSGRWILTVICGIVFAYVAIQKIIPVDATISILTMVFVSYFNRNDRRQDGNGVPK